MGAPKILSLLVVLAYTAALRLADHCNSSKVATAHERFAFMYCPEGSETDASSLVFDRPIPDYVQGLRYMVNSMGKQSISPDTPGKMDNKQPEQFQFYMDGYQKMTQIDFPVAAAGAEGVTAANFTSKFLNTNYFKKAVKAGKPVAALIFNTTTPERWSDKIPAQNIAACMGHDNQCDQAPVVTFMLPDKKTMVSATDKIDWLVVEPDTLESKGIIDWADDAIGAGSMAPSHTLTDPRTGDSYGAVTDSKVMPSVEVKVFRIKANAPTTREVIGSVKVDKQLTYMHAFGLSEDYVVIVENSVSFDVIGMMEGKPMLNVFNFGYQDTTKFHVMRLHDSEDGNEATKAGTYVTYDCGQPILAMHIGNTFLSNDTSDETPVLHMDIETYDIDANYDSPFVRLGFDNIFDKTYYPRDKSAYRRYSINLSSAEVTHKDLLVPDEHDHRPYGFTVINPAFTGKKNCFTYTIKGAGSALLGSTVKYDHCNERVAGEWNAGDTGLYPSEMIFIGDPVLSASDEDAGVLFGIVYNTKTLSSEAIFVNAKTMETLSTAQLPFRVPWPLHGQAFPIP